jgi:hypothetical protein
MESETYWIVVRNEGDGESISDYKEECELSHE